eukprot:SAG22_NODE_945_length_6374_cov_5.969562_6_plen_81_part_00
MLATIELADVLHFFDTHLAAGAPERRRIYAYVYGTEAGPDPAAEEAGIGPGFVRVATGGLDEYRKVANAGGFLSCFPSMI